MSGTTIPSPSLNSDSNTLSTLAASVKLHFSFDVEYNVTNSDIVFISIKMHNLSAGKIANLTYWESAENLL
ncbi:hypothetical protein QJS04_geneDACA019943 [Acorus gramineus]|uniref:Uncharacterized protein n=1 Tax=Acorus gramineus TaxID=55184 RepID=A0AAV9AJJ2_ACOGR|nr:hypothetical protein QJS04_geneDACA019943 [Acorus gramineus]